MAEIKQNSIVILYKGGRLPTWYRLPIEERRAYEQTHVNLMLSVAREQNLRRIEGFRLMTPQKAWERFWIIEFPTLTGAEAWIEAEMAPPYGRYGYYEYDLARPWHSEDLAQWITRSQAHSNRTVTNPQQIPVLQADQDSVVALLFERHLPDFDEAGPETRGDAEQQRQLKTIAQEYGLMRLEAFGLIGPCDDWHRAWVVEFPTLAGAEAWIETETHPPHSSYTSLVTFLARKWAPAYFSAWVSS